MHLPSPDGIYDVANPIDAFFHVGASPIAQIVLGIGAMESINHNGKMGMDSMHVGSDKEVGRFEAPIYGANQLKGKSESYISEMKLKEIKNGRLAMLGGCFLLTFCNLFLLSLRFPSFSSFSSFLPSLPPFS